MHIEVVIGNVVRLNYNFYLIVYFHDDKKVHFFYALSIFCCYNVIATLTTNDSKDDHNGHEDEDEKDGDDGNDIVLVDDVDVFVYYFYAPVADAVFVV